MTKAYHSPVTGLTWHTPDPARLGFIPGFLRADDPRPAREQIGERYVSGWHPFRGFEYDTESHTLTYPQDPPMQPHSWTRLRDETIYVYPHDWVLIEQKNGTAFEVARLD